MARPAVAAGRSLREASVHELVDRASSVASPTARAKLTVASSTRMVGIRAVPLQRAPRSVRGTSVHARWSSDRLPADPINPSSERLPLLLEECADRGIRAHRHAAARGCAVAAAAPGDEPPAPGRLRAERDRLVRRSTRRAPGPAGDAAGHDDRALALDGDREPVRELREDRADRLRAVDDEA